MKQKIKNFFDLEAWKEAHKLVLLVYEILKLFPKEETFGLIIQMKRSAVSITSNVAEGFGRRGLKEKMHFYSIASGSITELQSQILLARDIKFIPPMNAEQLFQQSIKVYKIINGLMKSLKALLPLAPSS